MDERIINRRLPPTQSILPVPTTQQITPAVPVGVSYTQQNYGIAPKPSRDDYPTFCNVLPPPPRDQESVYPLKNTSNCPYLPPQPYGKNSCYLLETNSQNVPGFFCSGAGGSGNSNFVRGNEFGQDYPFESLAGQNYYVNSNGDKPSALSNELLKSNSNFYPYPNQNIIDNSEYKSYPYNFMYSQDGKQLYRNLNKVLN